MVKVDIKMAYYNNTESDGWMDGKAQTSNIPLPLVIIVGLTIWVVMFGTIVIHAQATPCNFVRLNAGTQNMKTLTSLGYDLADTNTCKVIIQSIILNDASLFPDAPVLSQE